MVSRIEILLKQNFQLHLDGILNTLLYGNIIEVIVFCCCLGSILLVTSVYGGPGHCTRILIEYGYHVAGVHDLARTSNAGALNGQISGVSCGNN